MILPTPHPWTIAMPDGTRYFSNAPCAAQSALETTGFIEHSRYGSYDRAACMRLARMSREQYERWLEEQRERVWAP